MKIAYAGILAAHLLAAAAWFGAMFYSFFVLHPRARAFFEKNAKFEEFITHVSAAARWKVLGGCGLIAVTGGILFFQHVSPSATWLGIMVAKAILLTLAIAIFIYTSWRLWPARVMAASEEVPLYQRKFRYVALSLLIIVALCFVLSVLARVSPQ